jgi:hypothetical protein
MKYVRVIEQNGQESIALFPHSPEKVSHKEALAWLDFKEQAARDGGWEVRREGDVVFARKDYGHTVKNRKFSIRRASWL